MLLVFVACNESENQDETVVSKKDTVLVDTISEVDTVETIIELNKFRIEKLKEYSDSVNAYFQTFDWGQKDYVCNCKIDTEITDNYIHYSYRFKNPFDIFEFKTNEEASDYFNELMTIELVKSFGLNKRPNHILVDSNKVYWQRFEHPYGHRMKDINKIFKQVFNFYPHSSNLDSITGFNYCKHRNNPDTNLTDIFGNWYTDEFVKMDTIYHLSGASYNGIIKKHIDTVLLKITKDSISINKDRYKYSVYSSNKLPDASYYWKYRFIIHGISDKKNEKITKEFSGILEDLSKYRGEIIDYHVWVKYGERYSSFFIAKTNNNEIYLTLDNRFYILHKVE